MPDSCRFCLADDDDRVNPLLSPCRCTGTVKFVHRNCLRQWITITQFDLFKVNCQLCNSPYALPRRWLEERIPIIDKVWAYALSQTFIIVILIHYLHMLIITQIFRGETNALLDSPLSILAFNYLLFNTSLIYVSYYAFLIKKVINIQLYLYFSAFDLTRFIAMCGVCLYFIQHTIFPFGGIYIYLLSYYYTIHIQTLNKINATGVL